MTYNINNIIPVTVNLAASGLGFANFSSAVLFAPMDEWAEFLKQNAGIKYKAYEGTAELIRDFNAQTKTYIAASKFLSGVPTTDKIVIWGRTGAASQGANGILRDLNGAKDKIAWYWTFFTDDVYSDVPTVIAAAEWNETNSKFFINCASGSAADDIRNAGKADDVASKLTALGYRHAWTLSHRSDPYAGLAAAKWLAIVNWSARNSTITLEYKNLSGTAAEDLTATEQAAMKSRSKNSGWYGTAEISGRKSIGRIFNTMTHSSYGEFVDDVVNQDAFVDYLKTNLFNLVTSARRIPQTIQGQQQLIFAVREICELFIKNGFLGPRKYIDPKDGEEKSTRGYEILSAPEDIDDLTAGDRAERLSAPLRIRIFRSGAIHSVPIDIDVWGG